MEQTIKWVELYGTLREVMNRYHRWMKLGDDSEVEITELTREEAIAAKSKQRDKLIRSSIDVSRTTMYRIRLFAPSKLIGKIGDIPKIEDK